MSDLWVGVAFGALVVGPAVRWLGRRMLRWADRTVYLLWEADDRERQCR